MIKHRLYRSLEKFVFSQMHALKSDVMKRKGCITYVDTVMAIPTNFYLPCTESLQLRIR